MAFRRACSLVSARNPSVPRQTNAPAVAQMISDATAVRSQLVSRTDRPRSAEELRDEDNSSNDNKQREERAQAIESHPRLEMYRPSTRHAHRARGEERGRKREAADDVHPEPN